MEIILTIIKSIAEGLGGRPGTHKWEVITAFFGWALFLALVGMLGASLLGLSGAAQWFGAFIVPLLVILFGRDLQKLRKHRE